MNHDYLDRDGLLALGLAEANVDRLLCDTPLTGHDGRPVVEAERAEELAQIILREREGLES
jgi:hypothetical protein